MALKETIKEFIFLGSLVKELGLLNNNKTVFINSQSAIELAKNPEHHARTKHIDIQYRFVREIVQNKQVALTYIPTKEQKADVFTKALNTPNLKY